MVVIHSIPPSMERRLACAAAPRMAFTLMELMVAISILLVIILGVGVTFSGASRSVGLSQATMELMADVRGMQQLIERDVTNIDKSGFLVIRARAWDPKAPSSSPNFNLANLPSLVHFDQVSFISYGSFPNRSGVSAGTFTDTTVANAAHVWWGQLVMEKQPANPASGVAPSYVSASQSAMTAPGQLPTGMYLNNGVPTFTGKESDFTMGRHAFLLIPGPTGINGAAANQVKVNGQTLWAYNNLDPVATPSGIALDCLSHQVIGSDGPPAPQAHITSSRFDVVAQSRAQLMQAIAAYRARNPDVFSNIISPGNGLNNFTPEADLCTYRFRAVASVYDVDYVIANFANGPVSPFAIGYYRTTPIVMPSVSSFKVEWTDGTCFDGGNNPNGVNDNRGPRGQLRWFGPGLMHGFNNPDPTMERFSNNGSLSGDHYMAVFSYFNKASWPKALRFTYHVGSERLQGGRDFVQVINLPQ